jgi:hypothetical protein
MKAVLVLALAAGSALAALWRRFFPAPLPGPPGPLAVGDRFTAIRMDGCMASEEADVVSCRVMEIERKRLYGDTEDRDIVTGARADGRPLGEIVREEIRLELGLGWVWRH